MSANLQQEILDQFANGSLRHNVKLETGDLRSRNYTENSQGWRLTPNLMVVPIVTSAPTGANIAGTLYYDKTGHKLYIGEGGTAWKSATFT
jgi:hypothetical protein